MKRYSFVIVTMLACVWASGCAKPTDPATAANPSTPGAPGTLIPAKPKLVIAKNAGPDVVVSTFLEQTRAGNDDSATELLTTKAREETAKENLTLDLPVSPTMKFSIAKVEYLEGNKDAAYVNSVWTESFEKGEGNNFEIVWVLRRQAEGWRIAGMSAQNTPEEPPIFLNFEDPEHVQLIKEKITEAEPQPAPPMNLPVANGAAPPPANNSTTPTGFGQFQPNNGVGQPQQPANGPGQQQPNNGFGQPQPPNGFNPQPGNGQPQQPSNYGGQFPANSAQRQGSAPPLRQ